MRVLIPSVLRKHTDHQKSVEADGATVDEVLMNLARKCPALQPVLFNERKDRRQYIHVFLNDEDVRSLDEGRTKVQPKDVLTLIAAVSGG